jgi:DNA-binding CsgD family transcriptional regulator
MEKKMKGWWSVHLEADVGEAPEDLVEDLLEVLPDVGGSSPALSWSPHELSVWFSVRAPDVRHAVDRGLASFGVAADKLGIKLLDVPSVEATAHERLEREFEQEPDRYVGVSEIAALIGVSKQRVTELRVRPDFPAPVAELAAGPVWRESSLRRFIAEWPRRPGRPGSLLQAVEDLKAARQSLAPAELTDAQRRVFELLDAGKSAQQLAEELGISNEAVRSHVRRLYEKLLRDSDQVTEDERASR